MVGSSSVIEGETFHAAEVRMMSRAEFRSRGKQKEEARQVGFFQEKGWLTIQKSTWKHCLISQG